MPITQHGEGRAPHTRRQRGQSIAEFALVAPLLFFLIFGVLEGGLMLFSVGTARFAAGECARQESESGNAADADALSLQVVRSSALGTTTLATVTHIDIYHLIELGNGTLVVDSGKMNSYRLDGSPIGSLNWPSTSRDVINGQSDFLGVTVYYQYNWRTGIFLSGSPVQLNQTFYIRLEPQTY